MTLTRLGLDKVVAQNPIGSDPIGFGQGDPGSDWVWSDEKTGAIFTALFRNLRRSDTLRSNQIVSKATKKRGIRRDGSEF